MAHILIFCGTRAAIEKYDMSGVATLVTMYPYEKRKDVLNSFCSGKTAILACDISGCQGWRAPKGTFIVFDKSWWRKPDDPYTIQAVGRVAL